jgi:hypothetical protein
MTGPDAMENIPTYPLKVARGITTANRVAGRVPVIEDSMNVVFGEVTNRTQGFPFSIPVS